MEANQYACISLEIVKEKFKFQMVLPIGSSWDLCEQAIDDFRASVLEMKRIAHEQAAQAQAQEEVKEEILEEVKE